MGKEIGKERLYNKAFKNRNDIVLWDVLKVQKEQLIKIVIISTNSCFKQGVRLAIDSGDGYLEVNNQKFKSIQLWENNAPKEIVLKCFSANQVVSVYNIWDEGRGSQSMAHTSGMIIEKKDNILIYNCKDYGNTDKFDKLIFSIELMC